MGLTRKKYIIDKKFQLGISVNAIIFPLITLLAICSILLYYADITNKMVVLNNRHIHGIVENQDKMIELFLTTPALQYSNNPTIKNGVKTFQDNIGRLTKITRNSAIITENSRIFFYVIILMTIVQTIMIFGIFIFISHRISGPIHVMMRYLKEIQNGKKPAFRPLRKNDKLKDFYNEFRNTIEMIYHKDKK